MNYQGYFDLNIEPKDNDIWKSLCDYHIRTIAVNTHFDARLDDDVNKKKKEKKECVVPHPVSFEVPKELKEKITVVKRLTISLSDGNVLHKLVQSPNFKQYDIVAVIPCNQQSLKACCASNDIDLICFQPESRPQWSISRKLYNIAIQKHIYFELKYSPVISDGTSRRNTIQIASTYHTMGKSRNIIISSGTSKSELLRSPYDIINFAFLLGFNENKAKRTLTSNAKQLLLRAACRRHKKSILNISFLNDHKLLCDPSDKSEPVSIEMEE